LIVTVDLEDTEEVLDVVMVMVRMLEISIEERLPVYVVPLRPNGSKIEPPSRRKVPATVGASAERHLWRLAPEVSFRAPARNLGTTDLGGRERRGSCFVGTTRLRHVAVDHPTSRDAG
jgi:hypothetical protein